MISGRTVLSCLVLTPGLLSAALLQAQDSAVVRRDVIRGSILGDSLHQIVGAEVIVSMAPDRSFQRTQSDSRGRYEIVFDRGTGDYLVHVSAVGWKTFRKRVTRLSNDSIFEVNVILERQGVERLNAVVVTTSREKPQRGSENGRAPGTGAMEHTFDGVSASLSPGEAGDISATAGTIPTLLATPRGVSFGASPQQNSVTLNGLAFSGNEIPRDALTTVRVRTSVYDPAEGWFSGVQQGVELGSGIPLESRRAHVTVEAPFFQLTDPLSRQLGRRYSNLAASLGSQGFLNRDRLEYNFGGQIKQRVSNGVSLLSADPDVLQRSNIAPDSVVRLLSALSQLGGAVTGRAGRRVISSGSFVGLVGVPPFDFNTFKTPSRIWDIVGYASTAKFANLGSSATSTPGFSSSRTETTAALQAHLSTYIRQIFLTELRSAASIGETRSTPYLRTPAGFVQFDSDLQDGRREPTIVAFGGANSVPQDSRQWTWETAASVKLYPAGQAAHRVKLNVDSRVDGIREKSGANILGTFTYNSIRALELNSPVSFTRALGAPRTSGSEWSGFASIGDWWRKSDALQLLYGIRVEGNRFLRTEPYDRAVDSLFGQRTSFAPNRIHLSPRLGFTYVVRDSRSGFSRTPMGIFNNAPTGYLRGGIGEFRALLPASLVAGPSAQGRSSRTLVCIGDATPTPTWAQYAADASLIPNECIGGAATAQHANSSPSVSFVDRSYTAPRSWRANLAYGSLIRGMTFSIEGAYSLNLNQPGRSDLNFANVVQFVTSDEDRPVFVPSAAIVPGSGSVLSTGSRREASFGQIIDNVSNLRSVSRQATISLAPDPQAIKGWFASIAYTVADSHALSTGFDNTTFRTPLRREWARSDFDVRHRIVLQGGVSGRHLAVTLFSRIQSGFPFTPLVGADVNGDGIVNDRAFIFDPANTTDSSLRAGVRSLIQNSSRSARQCLTRQLGHPSTQNACDGPWTASLNTQFDFRFHFPRTEQASHFSVVLSNPLGGLDQLLHGASHLHGWGTNSLPDPVLYNVRGFDSVGRAYRYEVNPRFGDTRSFTRIGRVPFGITLDFSIDLAHSSDRQFIERELKPGRQGFPGPRLTAAIIKRRYSVITPDPYRAILQESDSLMLTAKQSELLSDAAVSYRTQRDSIFSALAEYLANLDERYNVKEVVVRQNETLDEVWDLGRASIKQSLPSILNEYQLRMLPSPADRLYHAPATVKGRSLAF